LAISKAYFTVKRSFEFSRHSMNLTLMVTGGYLTSVHQCFCSSSKSKTLRTQYMPIPVATLRTGRLFQRLLYLMDCSHCFYLVVGHIKTEIILNKAEPYNPGLG